MTQNQPKLLKHKPKKSQRSPPGSDSSGSPPSPPASPPLPTTSSSDLSKTPAQKGAGFSTSSGSPPPPGAATQKPVWSRFRTAITTVLVLNAVIIGYTLFRTRSNPKITEEVQSLKEEAVQHEQDGGDLKEAEKEKESAVDKEEAVQHERDGELKEAEKDKESAVDTSIKHEPSLLAQTIISEVQNRSELTTEQQQELFKWMLDEKRKLKPANAIERAQIDQEKALLKQYISKKNTL